MILKRFVQVENGTVDTQNPNYIKGFPWHYAIKKGNLCMVFDEGELADIVIGKCIATWNEGDKI